VKDRCRDERGFGLGIGPGGGINDQTRGVFLAAGRRRSKQVKTRARHFHLVNLPSAVLSVSHTFRYYREERKPLNCRFFVSPRNERYQGHTDTDKVISPRHTRRISHRSRRRSRRTDASHAELRFATVKVSTRGTQLVYPAALRCCAQVCALPTGAITWRRYPRLEAGKTRKPSHGGYLVIQ
jgi:hypothetical protein